jgi:hypothetical protein
MNNMSNKKNRKSFWEKLFIYPSFNIRFWFTLFFVLLLFIAIAHFLLYEMKVDYSISERIAIVTLVIQSATFVLGIFAAYYALRQLVETRFTGLDQAGMQELKLNHYSRAFEKWKEAFYIRPEAIVFLNMCESLLLICDYDNFDQYIGMSQKVDLLGKNIFQESSDKMILLYLRAMRYLLVKNQGEAEKNIVELVGLAKQESLKGIGWDFMDMQSSSTYLNLSGECKNIAENLMYYLSGRIQPMRKQEFEEGKYTSQIIESSNDAKV